MTSNLQKKEQDLHAVKNELFRASHQPMSFRNGKNSSPAFVEAEFFAEVDAGPLKEAYTNKIGLMNEENLNLKVILENIYSELKNLYKFKSDCIQKRADILIDPTREYSHGGAKNQGLLGDGDRLDVFNMPLFAGRKAVIELDTALQRFKAVLSGEEGCIEANDKEAFKQDIEKVTLFRDFERLGQTTHKIFSEQTGVIMAEAQANAVRELEWTERVASANRFLETLESNLPAKAKTAYFC